MTRGILIAGNESTLSAAIAAEAAKRVEHYAAALIPNRLSEQIRNDPPRPPVSGTKKSPARQTGTTGDLPAGVEIPLQWNPGSPIAARSLILAAENRLEHLDEAILICTPPSIRRRSADLLPADIEIMANDHIKGWFFLVRELAQLFRTKESGTLALVLSDMGSAGSKDDRVDLLGPAVAATFRAFAQSLLSSAYDEPYLTMAFSSPEIADEGSFAAFVFKQVDEGNKRNNGRWHKYGKLNLFR
ncbi:hypothetical protein AGMMS50268_12030 [Spirochaetia bacterium]|nr:hypothetical protein AGMMS50268_12030 [Spirochaetia bacterium]